MTRIDTIKKIGFPEETCPKCWDDGEQCTLCKGTGKFKQRMYPSWQCRELREGEKLIAIIDYDEWVYCGIVSGEQDEEVAFPFCEEFATDKHFEILGFEVQRT